MKSAIYYLISGILASCLAVAIYYLNTPNPASKQFPPLAAKEAVQAEPIKENPIQPLKMKPSASQVTPLAPAPEKPELTAWQIEHEQNLADLNKMAAQLKGLKMESREYSRIENEITERMKELGVTELHYGGAGMMLFPPNTGEALNFLLNNLDDERKSQFTYEISRLEFLSNLREEIEREMSDNKANKVTDSPDLLQRYHELIADEFRMESNINEIYDAYFDQESGY